jgi:hypothetical protein
MKDAQDFIAEFRGLVPEGLYDPAYFPGGRIERLIRDAWLEGHRKGLKDMREGLEAFWKEQREKA